MLKKAVIVCDGVLPETGEISGELSGNVLFIAADGGGNRAREMGLTPDVIIGDMDSFIRGENETARIILDPDQETNDLEKALQFAACQQCLQIVVFGATGKRTDHTLKNLSVLLRFDPQFHSLLFKDRYSEISLIRSPFRAEFPLSTSLSLFPLSGEVTGITTQGLKYPLSGETLKNGVRDGTSNETCLKQVDIEYESGDLLLIVNLRQT